METKTVSKQDLKFFVNILYPYKGFDELPNHICIEIKGIWNANDLKVCKRDVETTIKEEYGFRKELDW